MTNPTPEHGPELPENIREGAPYDDARFESLCREHGIWGTPESALCAVFWRAAIQAAVPVGFRLVPVEPTEAMLRPFWECPPDELRLAWEAMLIVTKTQLAASPTPPVGQLGGGVPLTLHQIAAIADGTQTAEPGSDGYILPFSFARAIEAAHGINPVGEGKV